MTTDGLTLRFNSPRPVELVDFAESLRSFGELYKSRLPAEAEEVRLYVVKVTEGSILVELAEMARQAGGALAPILTGAPQAVEFVKSVKSLIDYFKGEAAPPENMKPRDIELLAKALGPVADAPRSVLEINVNNSPGAIVTISNADANIVQNAGRKEIERLRQPVNETLKEVTLYWVQTRKGEGVHTGRSADKAVVEAVTAKPLPVYFPEGQQGLKQQMLSDVQFPYETVFIVDVETIVVRDRLTGYRVLALHGELPSEEAA
jgi:hypothetical protein